MKTELTTEQSQHLIDLGVPRELAISSAYVESGKYVAGIELPPVETPIFKLDDLLAILPKEIKVCGVKLPLMIEFDIDNAHAYYYCFRGYNSNEEELIDALYKLTVWCIEKGHLKFD